MRTKITLFIVLFLFNFLFATEYFVSLKGNDKNPGTKTKPFRTIQKAAKVIKPGDICYIRGGRYHEEILIKNLNGTADKPILFTTYKDEEVTLDGTIPIKSKWEEYKGNIFRTRIDTDIWQLFVDGKTMISARWPNARWEDGSIWNQVKSWAHQDNKSTYGRLINDKKYHNLAKTGKDFTGAIAIMNIGSWLTFAQFVKHHGTGQNYFTYEPNLWDRLKDERFWNSKKRQGWYFLECSLSCLDTTGEWFYNPSTGELYLWPEDVKDLGKKEIRGKIITYALTLKNCNYVIVRGLNFFGATFKIENCLNTIVEDSHLLYPSYSKRMLGILDEPEVTSIISSSEVTSNNIIRNCVFEYTDGPGLKIQGKGNIVENCYFHDIDYSCVGRGWTIDGSQGVETIFRRNTIHTAGASEGFKSGPRNIIELNHIYDCGHLQSDGGLIQVSAADQPGTVVRYNWCHDAAQANPFSPPKFGIRFDGSFIGYIFGKRNLPHSGTVHHNVVWNTQTFWVKGDSHQVYHNLSFDNKYMDLGIRSLTGQPVPKDRRYNYETTWGPGADHPDENAHTIIRNNLAGEISSSKKERSLGLPGFHSNNWEGDVRSQLRDPDNLDFRPKPEAAIIDAGYYVPGITGEYTGNAPDIGAYEFGTSNYWIPGYQASKASIPIPPDKAMSVKVDVDLMWLPGYRAVSNDIYFGTDKESVEKANRGSKEYMGNQKNNIFILPKLEKGKTYFWRIDTVRKDKKIKGDVWSFTVE